MLIPTPAGRLSPDEPGSPVSRSPCAFLDAQLVPQRRPEIRDSGIKVPIQSVQQGHELVTGKSGNDFFGPSGTIDELGKLSMVHRGTPVTDTSTRMRFMKASIL